MTLVSLEPMFIKVYRDGAFTGVQRMEQADGLTFLCPKCFGTYQMHWIRIWRPHVSTNILPGPGRWEFVGTGLSDLTLRASHTQDLKTESKCKAHFAIRNGKIEML